MTINRGTTDPKTAPGSPNVPSSDPSTAKGDDLLRRLLKTRVPIVPDPTPEETAPSASQDKPTTTGEQPSTPPPIHSTAQDWLIQRTMKKFGVSRDEAVKLIAESEKNF